MHIENPSKGNKEKDRSKHTQQSQFHIIFLRRRLGAIQKIRNALFFFFGGGGPQWGQNNSFV
jgi:hypothetical protein